MIYLQTEYGCLRGLDGYYTVIMLDEVLCVNVNRRRAKENLRRWIDCYKPEDPETGEAVTAVASRFEDLLE